MHFKKKKNKLHIWKLSPGTAEGTANVLLDKYVCPFPISFFYLMSFFSVCLFRSVPYFLALLFLVFTGENTNIQSLLIKTA